MFNFARRVEVFEVLVFDEIGYEWLKKCIPDNTKVGILNLRHKKLVIIKLSFFIRVFINYHLWFVGVFKFCQCLNA